MTHNAAVINPLPGRALDAPALLAWYDRHARELPWRIGPRDRAAGQTPDAYRVWLSEIMLQQTTVSTVQRFFASFLARWPTVAGLAAAPREDVLAEWAGLGYYARARNLHACAQSVMRDHGGRFPGSAAQLATLPGIGTYTSSAIAAICFNEKVAVVDGNVERVVARFHALARPARAAKPFIRAAVGAAVPARAGDFAQALMDLGATVCAPRFADCRNCPLANHCAARALGNPLGFPVASESKTRPKKTGHAFVFERADGAVWLERRPETGMLAAMTGVPGSRWAEVDAGPRFPQRGSWRHAGEVTHVFTHFELTLAVWHARAKSPSGQAGWWSPRAGLAAEALPTLYRKVLEQAGVTVKARADKNPTLNGRIKRKSAPSRP